MRDEHGMLRGVYISRHDFCPTFRWYETPAGFPGKRGSQPELKMLGFFIKSLIKASISSSGPAPGKRGQPAGAEKVSFLIKL